MRAAEAAPPLLNSTQPKPRRLPLAVLAADQPAQRHVERVGEIGKAAVRGHQQIAGLPAS